MKDLTISTKPTIPNNALKGVSSVDITHLIILE